MSKVKLLSIMKTFLTARTKCGQRGMAVAVTGACLPPVTCVTQVDNLIGKVLLRLVVRRLEAGEEGGQAEIPR